MTLQDNAPASGELRHLPWPDGLNPGNARIDALAVFAGGLYVALAAVPGSGQPAGLLRMTLADGGWQAVHRQTGTGRARRAGAAGLPADFPDPGKAGGPGLDAAYTGMAVFQGKSDAAPCLYVTTAAEGGARVLRSEDGIAFAPVYEGPADGILGLRSPVVWGGRLVMTGFAPAGQAGLPMATVLAAEDPALGDWQPVSDPGFGDAENTAISALAVHQGQLFAATLNTKIGFQLWSATAPGIWDQKLREGAARFAMNPAVAVMAGRGHDLWIGTTVPDKPSIPGLEWPAAEVIVLHADGDWDLVMGEPRFTPQGLRLPMALYGPGFDDPAATTVSVIVAVGDEILIGTGPAAWLWSSTDGEDWIETDLGAGTGPVDIQHGVTAAAGDGDRLWLAIDGEIHERTGRM